MKIAFFEIQGWEKRILKKTLKGHDLLFFKDELTPKNVEEIKNVEAISVFIYSKVSRQIISKLPQLKLITTRSTGYDHIDLKEASQRNVQVCNVPYYGENTVAEHTFALILALSRNVHKSYLRTVRNDFSIDGLQGFDLKGKTLGVIGAGNIGLHVIRIAKGFGMNVLVQDMHQNNFLAEVLGFEYTNNMEELLGKSDIITLHLPENKHTHHLINRQNIHKIKKGAILINTARGGVVETEALIEALDEKILAGVGLDVLEGEELIKEEKQLLYDQKNPQKLRTLIRDHILIDKDNVVFTPHIAFYSKEALQRIIETTGENILAFTKGEELNQI